MVEYGKALRIIRAVKELTQDQVAEAAGLSSNYLSMIESGKRTPSTEALDQLAKACTMPVWALVVLGSDDVSNEVRGVAMALLANGDTKQEGRAIALKMVRSLLTAETGGDVSDIMVEALRQLGIEVNDHHNETRDDVMAALDKLGVESLFAE